MRIFIALDIDDVIRERIQRFMDTVRAFAPDARWVRPESLHVTLKFIGEKPLQAVDQIKAALSRAQSEIFEIGFRNYGFFPNAKSARVFWIGIESGPPLAALASRIDDITGSLGIPKEEHVFSPHLTLARAGGRSGAPGWRKEDGVNRNFAVLQNKLSAMAVPEFGSMTAHEFFLYESKLMRGGSVYSKIANFPLSPSPHPKS
ncbi:MAG: RNA 2',3'-cyclic phosphodiesterase [Acidobacteriaceae bacterium]|nr:RNA 2',3'-cyclic phosphodiesterase [Acidobacteriaceae bacterium]